MGDSLERLGKNVLNHGLEVRRGNISGSIESTGSFAHLEALELSSTVSTTISGSFTAASSSLASRITTIDATTGKPYDDSEKGRTERLLREQKAGMRDEMGYQTSNYEQGGVALMKNNSATPYKLPHQSKTALHNNGGWNSSVVNSVDVDDDNINNGNNCQPSHAPNNASNLKSPYPMPSLPVASLNNQ